MPSVTASESTEHRYRKIRTGVVTSDKMDKTIVVAIERQVMHKDFHKLIRLKTTVKAHDEKNECCIGDRVQIIETRPLSKHKCWRVQKVVKRAAEGAAS